MVCNTIWRWNTLEIGARLKEMLDEKGWSQNSFADSIGVDRSHMSKIINDKATPTLKMLDRFAKELGVSMAVFFSEPNDADKEIISSWVKQCPDSIKRLYRGH
jgi:transcriptional regulator with XRE-family HTH domain